MDKEAGIWRTRAGQLDFEKMVMKQAEQQIEEDEALEKDVLMAVINDQEDGMKGDRIEKVENVIGAEVFFDHVNGGILDPVKVVCQY